MPELIAEDGNKRHHIKRLHGLIKSTKGIIRVASPYVTDSELLLGANNRNVYLLTSLSQMDIVSGSTKIDVLQLLIKSGVECRNLRNHHKLHAKVYIFGNATAIVTSANLTRNAFESNIEVGVQIEGECVHRLITWFDNFWENARPLSFSQLTSLQQDTETLRREFFELRSKSKSTLSKSRTLIDNDEFSRDLRDLLDNASHYFICNTDRRQGERDANGKFILEQMMYHRGYATAWETFNYPNHMQQVEPGDAIFMFAKNTGIIGIGRARTACKVLQPGDPDRVYIDDDSPEWRVPVDWLDWRDDNNAYKYKSQNATFFNVTDVKYSGLIKGIRKHFLGKF